MNYFELFTLVAPETVLVIAALAVLSIDLLFMREAPVHWRFIIGALFSGVGCAAALAFAFVVGPASAGGDGSVLHGMISVTPLTQFIKAGLLVLTVFTILISVESTFTTHVGEYLALILLATVGMMFLVSAEDLLMIFVSLELLSLSLYVLTAFNKQNIQSAEAALKYFLFGGTAAAFTLFGLSWIYGLSGATNLQQIASALSGKPLDPMLVGAIVMTVIGFGFKVAAVPFHLWAPDAYEGAPTPSAAFIASGSKVASFFIFAKVMLVGFAGAEGSGAWRAFVSGWVPAIVAVAALSMVLGNLTAVVQTSVKRLLAYSAIAHAGYVLLSIAANSSSAMPALLYYVLTYGLTTIGAFGVVSVVQAQTGGESLAHFGGLCRREPIISFCMLVFMLSLAGIPPLAGFFGKFYVFTAAVQSGANLGLLWLVVLAIATSAVSLYYYLKVLKQIYVADAPSNTSAKAPVLIQVVLCIIAALIIVFGCAPDLLLSTLTDAMPMAGFHSHGLLKN